MGGSDGTRAVSEVMGAILVFSLLVTALGAYQVVVVPNQNEQVEFQHSQEVQKDFIDLRNSIHRSATDGEDTSTSVALGVSYPVRALTLNPPEQGGTLQGVTTGPPGGSTQDLAVENATAIDGEIDDYWDNSTKNFTTGRVVYAPSYSLYHNAPRTVVENGLVYNKFENDDIPLSGQNVVSGREISLVAIESDISRSQVETTAVDVNAVSGTQTKIAVTNASNGDNVTVRIPTKLNESVWVGQLLDDQIDGAPSDLETCGDMKGETAGDDDSDRYIHNCTYTENPDFNVLTLQMERDTTYTLKLSKVSVGKTMAAPGAHYLTSVEGDNVSVPARGNQQLVLEVRDRFNNPVTGTKVNISLESGVIDSGDQETLIYNGRSNDSFTNIRTDEQGQIKLAYRSPSNIPGDNKPVNVQASLNSYANATWTSSDASTRENATFHLRVINASQINRTKPLFNPENGLVVRAANFTNDGCTGNSNDCHLNVIFENKADERVKITQARYVFYSGDSQGASPSASAGIAILQATGQELEFSGDTKSLSSPVTFGKGETKTIEFSLYEEKPLKKKNELSITEGEYFVFSFVVNQGERETYFIAPSDG